MIIATIALTTLRSASAMPRRLVVVESRRSYSEPLRVKLLQGLEPFRFGLTANVAVVGGEPQADAVGAVGALGVEDAGDLVEVGQGASYDHQQSVQPHVITDPRGRPLELKRKGPSVSISRVLPRRSDPLLEKHVIRPILHLLYPRNIVVHPPEVLYSINSIDALQRRFPVVGFGGVLDGCGIGLRAGAVPQGPFALEWVTDVVIG